MSAMPPPTQWPKQVSLAYTPERILGKGGFGCVYMASSKSSSSDLVAIKVVKDDGYAEREIAILGELMKYSHPNIVKILGNYAPQEDDPSNCMRCLVLSLARGPPLQYILKQRGALGLIIAQKIASQLVNTIAFLHGHGVIHRDIQPCNIIVSGTSAGIDDELWWGDELDQDGILEGYAEKCNITLVDFGFSRALNSHDLIDDIGPEMPPQVMGDGLTRGRSRNREDPAFDQSQTRKKVRDLSALGKRHYVAPEVLSGLRNFADKMNLSSHAKSYTNKTDDSTRSTAPPKNHTLSNSVSDYGMVADAFSLGATIRYMVTGVPPEFDVEDYIAGKNHPLKKAIRKLKKGNTKTKKHYRSYMDIPRDVMDLIQGLTHYDSSKRATVRSATGYPWIADTMPVSADDNELSLMDHGGPMEYLECAKTIP